MAGQSRGQVIDKIRNHKQENKKFNRLLKQVTLKYPAADLDSSLYDPERQLNTHVIELLAKGDWIDEPNNLLITGLQEVPDTIKFL